MVSLSMSVPRQSLCNNVFTYISLRQEVSSTRLTKNARAHCLARHIPVAITEKELAFGDVDKIFAAEWLDESHIIVGTKCNKLIVQNIISRKTWEIPVVQGSSNIPFPDKNCGIHCISVNSNVTTLATGAENPNSVGFYRLPTIEPICIGEFHTDWLFSSAWISNDVLATGSRDKCVAFWAVNDDLKSDLSGTCPVIKPVQVIEGNKTLDRVRAMVYNPYLENLATIASNGFIHLWDVNNGVQVASNALPFLKENVCIAHEKSNLLYAVGSLSHVSLLETRSGRAVGSLCSNDQGAGICPLGCIKAIVSNKKLMFGVRSISFNDCIITIGTGYGSILFYDIRMNKMLSRADGTTCQKKTGKGWLRRDDVYQEFFWDTECYPNAVYAHSYHPTSMKLLTVGGPLALGLYGNYAAYWD